MPGLRKTLLAAFIICSYNALAQEDTSANAYKQGIYLQDDVLMINGRQEPFKNLERYFTKDKPSWAYFQQYKANRWNAGRWGWTGVGIVVAGVIFAQKSRYVVYGSTAGMFISTIAVTINIWNARNNLHRAIKERNKELLYIE